MRPNPLLLSLRSAEAANHNLSLIRHVCENRFKYLFLAYFVQAQLFLAIISWPHLTFARLA